MMDEFFEYWKILPQASSYESIGQEIVRYKRNLQDADVSSMDLSDEVINFLQEKLLDSPYPTNQIVLHIIDAKDHEKNQVLEDIIFGTVNKLIEMINEDPYQLEKLYNLLSNIYISDENIQKVQINLFPVLYDLKENKQLLDHVLYFALLSRNSLTLLKLYLEYERNKLLESFDERTVFLQCVYEQKHWLSSVLNHQNDKIIKNSFSPEFYEIMTVCKMILDDHNAIHNQAITDVNEQSVIDNNYLHLCFLELSRQNRILRFLNEHSESNSAFDMAKSHLMTQLLKLDTPFMMENYDKVLELLNFNYENNLVQSKKLKSQPYTHKTEMQLFNEYMLIKLYILKILQKDYSQESSETHVNHIRSLLKTINDGSILYKILHTVFYLTFIRYEHVRKTRLTHRDLDSSNISNSIVNSELFVNCFSHHGFICSKENLEILLNSMRLFLMSLDVTEAYKNCDNELKDKFANLLHNVDIGLWKLSVIHKNYYKCSVEVDRPDEWLLIHNETLKLIITTDSDDDENESGIKQARKKSIKRTKTLDVSAKSQERGFKDIENESFCAAENSQQSAKNKLVLENENCEGFIAKMVMSPESLVAFCIKNNDDENALKAILDYHLEGTHIEQEYRMMKSYQETLNDLKSIATNYIEIRKIEDTENNGLEVKNGSEAELELIKLTDSLKKYCQPEYNHLDKYDQIFDSLKEKMPNLVLHKKIRFVLIAMMDLMISLSSKFEITFSLSKCIFELWRDEVKGEHEDYFVTFLIKIVGIINSCKIQKIPMSLRYLMNNEIFSFDPVIFKIQKENRRHLINLMKVSIGRFNDDHMLLDIASKLNDFNSDINYFKRILSHVNNARNIIKCVTIEYLNINEIIKDLNIYELIGKIVYVDQINPESLEIQSHNVNLNLLHAIAIAGGSEFMSPLWMAERSGDGMSLSSQNVAKKEVKFFNVSNTTILFYIKKSGSFLTAYLIKEIQKFNYQSLKFDQPNFFSRLKELESIEILKEIYGNNSTLAAINYDFIDMNLLLDRIKDLNKNTKLIVLSSINERNVHRNKVKFDELKDDSIENLINDKNVGNVEEMLKKIGNVRRFNDLLLKHMKKIKSDEKLEALLNWSLCNENQKNIQESQQKELNQWLKKIKIYRQILKLFREVKDNNDITWINILEMAENDTSVLINFLINEFTDLELCNELLKFHPLQDKNEEVFKIFIEALNKRGFNDQHDTLFKIIRNYSGKFLNDFYDYSLDFIHNMKSMEYILGYLMNSSSNNYVRYQKFQVSCIIIKEFDATDEQLWLLSPYPLILIEQLLMNSKIEMLSVIVKKLRKMLENQPACNLCNTTSKGCAIGETLVYDFNAYHNGYTISNDCLDFLFKIYAAKALDFQIVDITSQTNPSLHSGTQGSDVQIHHMPKDVPSKDMWVKDNEAVFCMCCKKSKFSLLNRRHHCRRCGNVICGECSRKRVSLPDKYNDLMVRCCDECYSLMETKKRKLEYGSSHDRSRSADMPIEWKLTGDIDVDQMIRDEFTFEYSPNVGRCIAIVSLHRINIELIEFILLHCHRLELLLHPVNGRLNPEIDIILVGSMLKYLAKTAKLFGDTEDSNVILEKIDIILKIAESECDSILSKAKFKDETNDLSINEIINELVRLENWKLALDLSVKTERTRIPGVFSAWAITLIKGGHYKLARSKITYVFQPVNGSTPKDNEEFMDALNGLIPINNATFSHSRPRKGPQLLSEILDIIDASVPKFFDSTLTTSSQWKSSSPKESPKSHANSMDHIKKMMEGDYGSPKKKLTDVFVWDRTELTNSAYFIESMHYLVSYGGNTDILEFFIRNNLINYAIRYTLIQKIPSELFIQFVIIPIIRSGRLVDFINALKQIDGNFILSKKYIDAICKYLDAKKSLQVLYQVYLLIDDNIRAALTCLKLYLVGAGNFNELVDNTRQLLDAKNLLQIELERAENGFNTDSNLIQLKWDIKAINAQINTISLQLEVTKYLASCEANGFSTLDVIPKLFDEKISLKTLLGKSNEKSQVAILLLICGRIESSFGICYRIIQECALDAFKIYSSCTKYLARDLKSLMDVEKLINCIKTNENTIDPEIERICDELISMAIQIAYNQYESTAKVQIDRLIKLISSKTIKIECYINSNQLKTAFVHSAALNYNDYISRIQRLAKETKQETVRILCEKKLRGIDTGMDSSGSDSMFGESSSNLIHK